ncbi:MAG: lyase family protein [Dongiaceae bacterium]
MATVLRFGPPLKESKAVGDRINEPRHHAVPSRELLPPSAGSTAKRLDRWRKVLRSLETDAERHAFFRDLEDFYAATSGAADPEKVAPIPGDEPRGQERVNDTMYVDRQHKCFIGAAYQTDGGAFAETAGRHWPDASLQWKDAGTSDASRRFAYYLGRRDAFKDDIQRTNIKLLLRSMNEAGADEDGARCHYYASQQSGGVIMTKFRLETDSLGEIGVPADKLWGAQTQRMIEHFGIEKDIIPREMIAAYAILKKAAAKANYTGKRLDDWCHALIVQVCDEILAGEHHDMFPLHIWTTDAGIQFDTNVNEVIANRCCQLTGMPLGSKAPVHPDTHVNLSQSAAETFPAAMHIAVAVNVTQRLIPAIEALQDAIATGIAALDRPLKIDRAHKGDVAPGTSGEEWAGYVGMLGDDLRRIDEVLYGMYRLSLGGMTAGAEINTAAGFAEAMADEVTRITNLPFASAPRKCTARDTHDALVQLSGTFRTLAVSLHKIGNGMRFPGNEQIPSKTTARHAEALTMIAAQVMANDVSMGFAAGAGGYLEMNIYKPLMISHLIQSIVLMTDGCRNFRQFLVGGTRAGRKKINEKSGRSLILVTALEPAVGCTKASKIVHYAMDHDLTLKAAALHLGFVTGDEVDSIVDPANVTDAYVAQANNGKRQICEG